MRNLLLLLLLLYHTEVEAYVIDVTLEVLVEGCVCNQRQLGAAVQQFDAVISGPARLWLQLSSSCWIQLQCTITQPTLRDFTF